MDSEHASTSRVSEFLFVSHVSVPHLPCLSLLRCLSRTSVRVEVGVPTSLKNIDAFPKDEIVYSPEHFFAGELQVYPPNELNQPIIPADSLEFPSDHKQLRAVLRFKHR